ncbi:MAG: nucleotide exchange factor GrpE [Verrucomicrobiota bacterium]|nr:nucleotide exchange factor GrpE [Verrucomicrobiota bacterium]
MSSKAKQEDKESSQIEIAAAEQIDTSTQADPEADSQALGQAEEEPESDESQAAEEELPPPTPDELKALREQAAKAAEYYDRLQRQVAEADNLRKRLAKEKQEAIRYANEALIEDLLPTMDSFEMAISATRDSDDNAIESLKTGIEMVYTQLKRTLEEVGVTEIDAVGQAFDPSRHEAMSRKQTDEAEEGTVIEQTRKGYQLRDRLLRASSVVVATPMNDAEEEIEQ